ncbi:hypothetical protein CEXT_181431 [Caerostris extrusa]|uniref:Uncharacterized protein n=1 Tax=Caerostris extrusa TaxID=172846 RepID=A0AAV4WX32_CAEEX|nr:hypothetical protein CEXT_181431 [Caerostris extrusa]
MRVGKATIQRLPNIPPLLEGGLDAPNCDDGSCSIAGGWYYYCYLPCRMFQNFGLIPEFGLEKNVQKKRTVFLVKPFCCFCHTVIFFFTPEHMVVLLVFWTPSEELKCVCRGIALSRLMVVDID